MAAHSEPIVSYKAIHEKIDDLEEVLADLKNSVPRSRRAIIAVINEINELDAISKTIWSKFLARVYFLRLLRAIDTYADPNDVPSEFIDEAEQIIKEMDQSIDIVKAAIANRTIRLRLINNFERVNNVFIHNELKPSQRDRIIRVLKLESYIDSGIERKLLQIPPDQEMVIRLSGENEEFIRYIRNWLVGNEADGYVTIPSMIHDIHDPDARAKIYARLGDYALLHEALEDGARMYGFILDQIGLGVEGERGSVDRSPWYTLNVGDRRLLSKELIDIITSEQNIPHHFYEVTDEGVIYAVSPTGIRYKIGTFNVKWLNEEE